MFLAANFALPTPLFFLEDSTPLPFSLKVDHGRIMRESILNEADLAAAISKLLLREKKPPHIRHSKWRVHHMSPEDHYATAALCFRLSSFAQNSTYSCWTLRIQTSVEVVFKFPAKMELTR